MLKRLSLLILLFFTLLDQGWASHIVGGEFELIYSGRGNRYQLRLNMYFDDINADPGLIDVDLDITAAIYERFTNRAMTQVRLARIQNSFITYSNNGCSDPGIIRTRILRYVGNVDLTGFDAPQGYYVIWERCCRNYTTKNIIHKAGQTFYLEFPPAELSGVRNVNTSPVFGIIAGDYLCKGALYTSDFSGTDYDGDSLVYSLVTPLKGHATIDNSLPNSMPAPYDSVQWVSGYSRNNQIPGTPALTVNKFTGMVSVTPSDTGLFAFAIRVEEFRNGVKIGEARRDFQFFVKNCPPTYPPIIKLKDPNPAMGDTLTVFIDKDTCYKVFVSDSSVLFHNRTDDITIYNSFTTLPQSAFSFSPGSVRLVPSVTDSIYVDLCFSACEKINIVKDSVFLLDMVVRDAGCPNKTDTLRTHVKVIVPPTDPPLIYTSLSPITRVTLNPDSLLSFMIYATDPDADLQVMEGYGEDFAFSDYDMNFAVVYQGTDSAAAVFTWEPDCALLKERQDFKVVFKIRDKSCVFSHVDTTSVTIRLEDIFTTLPDYLPINLVTPNQDGLNDVFELINLPADNCEYSFKRMDIYNRWGSRVYQSTNRYFRWDPTPVSDGMYYFLMDLNKKKVKGWVQVIR